MQEMGPEETPGPLSIELFLQHSKFHFSILSFGTMCRCFMTFYDVTKQRSGLATPPSSAFKAGSLGYGSSTV